MKKIGLKQWVIDLLDNEEKLEEESKMLTSDDEFRYGKRKLVDNTSTGIEKILDTKDDDLTIITGGPILNIAGDTVLN